MSDLRPTLFLAQLPNLLAGNISLVHGVVGSSRTFMGEEAAGVDAVRVAQARIAAGQSELTLVGGAYNGTRWDVLLAFELGGVVLKDKFAPVWDRGPGRRHRLCHDGRVPGLRKQRPRQSARRQTAGADFAGVVRPQCAKGGPSRGFAAPPVERHRPASRPQPCRRHFRRFRI